VTERSNSEIAEKLSSKRARILLVLGIIFLAQQAAYFSDVSDLSRTVDHVKIAAWLVLSIALLALLATGGGWFRSPEVRALLNDESTREHRRRAYVYGFWAAMGTAIGLYAIDMFQPVSGHQAVHIIMTIAIGTALLNFAFLERRAHRNG
jgi:hypothetical protein